MVEGQVRLLIDRDGEIETISRRGSGQFIGWISLLRADPCEWVSASEESVVLAISSKNFLRAIFEYQEFREWFFTLSQPQETYCVSKAVLDLQPTRSEGWQSDIDYWIETSIAT